jgi:Putative DNA-binding domain
MPAIRVELSAITSADIQRVIVDAWPEDEELEFKQEIPSKNGQDRWYLDQSRIADYGRDKLLAEVVALANSYGGDLVIGVVETRDKPARAAGLKLVPAAAELAARLEMAARDCIEPAIPLIKARGIVCDEATSAGVVVVRVPRSSQAPHRLKPTRECYRRSRDRTEAMSMREIQDLTFSVSRGIAAVESRLETLRSSFDTACRSKQGSGHDWHGLSVRAFPISTRLSVEKIHGVKAAIPSNREFTEFLLNGRQKRFPVPLPTLNFRPILRGSRAAGRMGASEFMSEIYGDGAIAESLLVGTPITSSSGDRPGHGLRTLSFVGMILNVAETADRFRSIVGAGAVEYALDVEVFCWPSPLPVLHSHNDGFPDDSGTLPVGSTLFPRYVLHGAESRPELLTLIWRDLWNAAGVDAPDDVFTRIS